MANSENQSNMKYFFFSTAKIKIMEKFLFYKGEMQVNQIGFLFNASRDKDFFFLTYYNFDKIVKHILHITIYW